MARQLLLLGSAAICFVNAERRRTEEFWHQRFEALRKEQADTQREIERKEAAYKEHVDQRLKAVEVLTDVSRQRSTYGGSSTSQAVLMI